MISMSHGAFSILAVCTGNVCHSPAASSCRTPQRSGRGPVDLARFVDRLRVGTLECRQALVPGGARIPLDGSVPAGGAQERLLQSPLGCQPSSARARSMASRGGLARGNLHGLAPPTDYGRTVGRTHAERSRFTNSSTVPWSSGCGEVVDRPDGATRPARPAVRRG